MKKLISIALAFITTLGLFCVPAFAEEQNKAKGAAEGIVSVCNIEENIKTLASGILSAELTSYKSDHVHIYNEKGKCTICNQKRNTYKKGFPSYFYKTCPEAGKLKFVKSYKYKNKTYNIPEVLVYIPYGYKKTNKYNILFLIHGKNGSKVNWLKDNQNMAVYGGSQIGKLSGAKLFDWLIYTGEAAPFIAISVDLVKNTTGTNPDVAYNDYALQENIVNYYIPYVVRTFSTYAKSPKVSDVKKAKSHFAICGASRGSTTIYQIALNPKQSVAKMFGHKFYLSGTIDVNLMKAQYGKSKDKLYFATGGSHDWACKEAMKKYKGVLPYEMFIAYDSGHTWYTWFRACAAGLQLAMK